jgi:hypothetical protein
MKNPYPVAAIVLAILYFSIPAGAQAPMHVQTKSKITTSAAASINLNFTSASTSGNLIVVHLTWDKQSRDVNTVTDSKSNVYHPLGAATNWGSGSYRSQLFYAYNISAGASPLSITATLNGAVNSLYEIYISEYSNVLTTSDPLDQTSINASSGTTVTSNAVSTTAANELVYGVAIGKTITLGAGTGFNTRSTDQSNIVEDESATTPGSYSTTFTGGGFWIAQVATFKPLVVLPIGLTSFDAMQLQGNKVELSWNTATEDNSDHFEADHSPDGQNWTEIGRVNAAGNSVSPLHYSFADEQPYSGVCYYRLKEVDRDGNAMISKTVTIHIEQSSATTFKLYPNPAVSYLVVEGASQPVTIFNMAGQRMFVRVNAESDSKATFDLTSLAGGAYFVKAGTQSVIFFKH